jgi:hypothetical protein
VYTNNVLFNAYRALKQNANILVLKDSVEDNHFKTIFTDLVRYEENGVVTYSQSVANLNYGAFKGAALTLAEREALHQAYLDGEVNPEASDC